MIENPNYLPLHRDHLVRLHWDIPYIHIRRSPYILVIQVQMLAPMGGSDGLEPKRTTNESALRVGYGLTVIRWGSPVPLLPLPALASHAIR